MAHASATPNSRALLGHTETIKSVCFGVTGHVISGSYDRTLRVWDAVKGRCVNVHATKGRVLSVAAGNESNIVVSGSSDGNIQVWDGARGRDEAVMTITKGQGTVSRGMYRPQPASRRGDVYARR